MLSKAVLFLAAVLVSQVCTAAELFPKNLPRAHELADKLEADATMGGYPIWAGEGRWRIAELVRSDSSGSAASVPMGAARFIQTEGKNFVAAMEVRSNLQSGSGYWMGEPCKRDDILFKSQLAGGREDNCVTINHITRYMSNPGGKSAELFAIFREQGIDIPPTVIQFIFTRNAQSLRTLTYTLWINPELSGQSRETEPEWGRNPWNKTMSFKDPAKKQYIDALIVWATNFQKRMNDALDQKSDAFAGIPSWRSVVDVGVVKPEPAKVKVVLD